MYKIPVQDKQQFKKFMFLSLFISVSIKEKYIYNAIKTFKSVKIMNL